MNSDNYEFSKSSAPQDPSDYSAYTDKQWNYVNDINSGVYNTSGQSLVQFDLSNIYNSGLSDVSDLYLAIPIVMVAACSAGATLVAPGSCGYSLCALKSNYQHLIHQIEVVANGKVINDMQPFVSVYKNFKLLSSLSATDQQANVMSLGLSNTLDNEKSVKFTTANLLNTGSSASAAAGAGTAAPYQGVGLCNNLAFSTTAAAVGPVVTQNTNQSNKAIYDRCSKIIDISGNATYQGIFGTSTATQIVLMTSQNVKNEFKP